MRHAQAGKSSDFLQLELVAIYSVKLMRAQAEGNVDAAQKQDMMILRAPVCVRHAQAGMKDLKATKVAGPHPISDTCGHEYHSLVCGN